MVLKQTKLVFLILLSIGLSSYRGLTQETYDQQHIEVALRMIGHKILLNANDSMTLVLPIERENDRYRIKFESDFAFNPDELVSTVNSVLYDAKLDNGYIVEVENCDTGEIVYSYEIGNSKKNDLVPCQSRDQPKSRYNLLITLLESQIPIAESQSEDAELSQGSFGGIGSNNLTLIGIVAMLSIAALYFLWRRKQNSMIDLNVIQLGEYRFDKRNAKLITKHQEIELTSKESDLLLILYNAVNTTIEREVILKMVWGDEGDYVGRTLDVFISKLRKKLEADSNVKIVNIRGVGYKLVMDA